MMTNLKNDVTDEIGMTVSPETGMMYHWGADTPFDCTFYTTETYVYCIHSYKVKQLCTYPNVPIKEKELSN